MNLTPEQMDRIYKRIQKWENVSGARWPDQNWFSLDICEGVTLDGCYSLEWLRELVRLIDAELAAPSAAEQG